MLVKSLLAKPVRLLSSNNARFIATKIPQDDLVLTKEVNDRGLLVLNRPKALNAASIEMLIKLADTLNDWKDKKSLIVVRGNGKAFCAGGDVRAIVEADPMYGTKFSKIEYSMNHLIGNLKIPYIALLNGITMGGGVGIAIHGKYRVATEQTIFAMPETTIGLFPDIGASYFLPRLQGKLGFYLGLTGLTLKAHDVYHTGIATHFCENSKIPELEHNLLHIKNTNDVKCLLDDFCPKVQHPEFSLGKNLDRINECFNAESVEEILDKLEKDGSEWASKTSKRLRTVSPTSLKVTFRQLSLGEKLSLGECLQMEYRLAFHFLRGSDFHEGVRALLIGKDKNPQWNPPCIEDVPAHRVRSFFNPLPDNDELPINEKLQLQN